MAQSLIDSIVNLRAENERLRCEINALNGILDFHKSPYEQKIEQLTIECNRLRSRWDHMFGAALVAENDLKKALRIIGEFKTSVSS